MIKLTRIWLICMVALIGATVALYIIAELKGFITGNWPAITVFIEVISGILVYCWLVSKLKEAVKEETKRAIWMCSIIVIIAAGLLILLLIDKIDVGQVINILVLLGLVLITAEYARQTTIMAEATKEQAKASVEMAEEMKQQRYDALRPIIDIVVLPVSAQERIKQGFDAKEGKSPSGLPCMLRNIGVGPATNVFSFIEHPEKGCLRWDFGTIPVATGEEVNKHTREIREEEVEYTREAQLSIQQRGEHKTLVAYYKDVYENSFESSRKVRVIKEKVRLEIGPLKVRKLPKEEITQNDT